MKKLICHLLIVWVALFAGGANAHGISDSAHGAEHTGHAHSGMHVAAGSFEDVERGDADFVKVCSHSHCGHSHATGILGALTRFTKVEVTAVAPVSGCRWASAAVIDNIERPKWTHTTPVVVSLLS